ncbi:response regulator transcription factor [Pontibacter sp. BT731]|jgi:DNA-binding NarL/FixJ family response regulator|uniref:response regulator n=1 Tax=Pontibacter coccineus TaxID=3063328 RepID=UPI0026E17ADD|nr:response regulator transcription factor [Pontibacter sp. BT731]MDO6390354.1 response regulator transcription factor [Pontibacter sp. BT731]
MELQPLTLAIADDHTLFRKGVIEILKNFEEITVISDAANGAELLEKIEGNLPDIIMLDLEMPDMDGIAVARYVLSKYRKVKILIVSMYGEEELVKKLLDEGVHGYLLKSADPEELREVLQLLRNGKTHYPVFSPNYFTQRTLR